MSVQQHTIFGDDSKEVPPVPIPNTVVKLFSVLDTWRVTARERRTLPERKRSSGVYESTHRIFVILVIIYDILAKIIVYSSLALVGSKPTERCRWQKKRGLLGAAVDFQKENRVPQE